MIAVVFLLWIKVLTTLMLAAATGVEGHEGMGVVGVYVEPLPRWNNHDDCRLEILHPAEADLAAMPEVHHSMHRLDFVHRRIAEWAMEKTTEITNRNRADCR